MSSPEFTSFERLILHSKNELGTSVLLLLTWIAACDGTISDSENETLSKIADSSHYHGDVGLIIRLAQDRDIAALKLASEVIKKHFSGKRANSFLSMAIGLAIADGLLKPAENFILRFLADLVGIRFAELRTLFKSITTRELPEPSDPSTARFWQARESGQQDSRSESGSKSDYQNANQSRPSQASKFSQAAIHAHAVLGLELGASPEDIKIAYRRLAQIHHPDRYSSLGQESVAAATITFQRIQAAYKYLVQNA